MGARGGGVENYIYVVGAALDQQEHTVAVADEEQELNADGHGSHHGEVWQSAAHIGQSKKNTRKTKLKSTAMKGRGGGLPSPIRIQQGRWTERRGAQHRNKLGLRWQGSGPVLKGRPHVTCAASSRYYPQ